MLSPACIRVAELGNRLLPKRVNLKCIPAPVRQLSQGCVKNPLQGHGQPCKVCVVRITVEHECNQQEAGRPRGREPLGPMLCQQGKVGKEPEVLLGWGEHDIGLGDTVIGIEEAVGFSAWDRDAHASLNRVGLPGNDNRQPPLLDSEGFIRERVNVHQGVPASAASGAKQDIEACTGWVVQPSRENKSLVVEGVPEFGTSIDHRLGDRFQAVRP